MDRRTRDRYDNDNFGSDYAGYEGYSKDEHYHSGRNITNEFERDYRNERVHYNDSRNRFEPDRTYHEGDMGGAYEQRRREGGNLRGSSGYQQSNWDQNRNYPDDLSRDRDRFSNYQDDYRSYQGMQNRDRAQGGNIRQGYGISDFEGTSDRYNTLNSNQNRDNFSTGTSNYAGSRYGSGMGESFPHSHGGVPDYGTRNYGANRGTGMGSTYGGSNYGGGTGYMSGHRGGSYGNSSYGTSSGNYGGYGSMGSSTYGGRGGIGGETSHNTNRGTSEFSGL